MHKLNNERSTVAQELSRDDTMKLVPSSPPGRSTRRARGYAAEMCELRAQGYTFEAIRQALAAVGVRVSNATVQREVARVATSGGTAVDLVSAGRPVHGHFVAAPAPPPDRPDSTPPSRISLDGRSPAEMRSAKEIAEAFTSSQITNPLVRARHIGKDIK